MLRIRLLRVGKKNSPSFRVVVTPRRTAPKTGRFLEILGSHNPLRHERVLKGERIKYWLSQGAQPSARVQNMLISEGIIEGEKVATHKAAKKKEEVEGATEEVKETVEAKEGEVVEEIPGVKKEGADETKEETTATEEKKPVEEIPAKEETPEEEIKETPTTEEGGEETPTPESEEEKKEEPATEE